MFVHFFYFVPLLTITIYCLLYPSQSYFPDWALLLAGASAQVFIFNILSFETNSPSEILHLHTKLFHKNPFLSNYYFHYFQGQFAYIGSSLHHRTPFPLRVPLTDFHRYHFWFFNLLLLIVPQLLVWRCQNNLDFFAQTTKDAPRLTRQLSNRLKSE